MNTTVAIPIAGGKYQSDLINIFLTSGFKPHWEEHITMTQCNLATLDGAEMVVVENDAHGYDILVAWFGGTTFNVYVPTHSDEYPLDETAVFSASDENGEPLTRDEAESHAREWLQETIEEQQ